MPITQDTSQEIQNLLEGDQHLPAHYGSFLLKWLAFNRAYNDTETDRQEVNRVINFSGRFEHHWLEIVPLSRRLHRGTGNTETAVNDETSATRRPPPRGPTGPALRQRSHY